MRAAAAALAVAALLLAGCGGGDGGSGTAPPPPPPSGTGYFAGARSGVGASLDMLGDDPVARAVERALLPEAAETGEIPVVAVASVVNDTPAGFDPPTFVAILEGGRAVILEPAMEALRGARGPAARAARELLREVPGRVPARGGGIRYLVMRGARPDEVASVRMAAGPEPSITLSARRR